MEVIGAPETGMTCLSWVTVGVRPQCILPRQAAKSTQGQRNTYLGFDEGSQGPLAQLRRHLFIGAERRSHHLPCCTVHIDEVDQAWEILQVGEDLS